MSVKFIIQFGRSKVSLFVFHASCSICSQGSVTESLTVPLRKICKTFLSDSAELERQGTAHGPDFLEVLNSHVSL